MAIGTSEAETFWIDFLRSLARRGLRGVKLIISDAHEGIKAAVSRVFSATWQRCRALRPQRYPARRQERAPRRLSLHRHGLCAGDARGGQGQWRKIADQLRPSVPNSPS